MSGRRLFPEIFHLALAVVVLEVSYTRVFSFKLVYYFTYLLIGIALLGLGSGGILVALVARLRRAVGGALIPACCAIASLGVLVGYAVVAWMPLNAFDLILALRPLAADVVLREGAKLVAVCAVLFVPFLAAGIGVAAILATGTDRIHRLYFADLIGAGLGCAICVPLISRLSPPGGVCFAGAVFALAGLRLAVARARPLVPVLVSVGGLLLLGAVRPDRLPDPIPDRVKGLRPRAEGGPEVLFSRWSAVFRIDVVPTPLEPDSRRLIHHDAMPGSALNRYDGDAAALTRFDSDQRAYPFAILGPGARVAIIGAAGGHDILAALHFDAAHVTAVELNPVTVSLLTTHFADWTGHLGEHPRVTLVNGEGRWFLARDPARYDLIWFVAPDSYAAMNAATSGAFVLSESYLYLRPVRGDRFRRQAQPHGAVPGHGARRLP